MGRLIKWFLILGVPGFIIGANWSMPGSWLYPVKLSVTEPIWSASISFLPKTSADWAVILIQRRVIEAGILANKSLFTSTQADMFQKQISDRYGFVDAKVEAMAKDNSRLLDASSVASNLEAVLNGGADGIKQKSDNEDVKKLTEFISGKVQSIYATRVGIEENVTTNIDEHSAFTVMDNKLYELDQNIKQVQLEFENNREKLNQDQSDGVGKLIEIAKQALDEARGLHNGEQSKFAFVSANKGERAELEAKVFLDIMTQK